MQTESHVTCLSATISEPSSFPTPPALHKREGLLDSWKEIASFFGRDVRTVQMWEKREGLPVHRHFHVRRASVHAYRSELQAWQQTRRFHWSLMPAAGIGAEGTSAT